MIESIKNESVPDLLLAENKITVQSALNAPTIIQVKNEIGENDLMKVVSFMIATCISNFNVTTKPTDKQQELQIYTMANDMIDKFKRESLEDFALCFKRARRFEFGTTFNRIDSETLFGWMAKHLELNAEERERQHYIIKHPKKDNENIAGPPKDPEARMHYDSIQQIAKGLKTGNYKSVKDIFPKIELPTHEKFLASLTSRIKMMNEKEMADLLKQAANGKLYDVIKLVEEEKEKRK